MMRPVLSSHIQAVGYDAAARTLHVDYGGKTAVYRNVPPEIAANVTGSVSIGAALHEHIRGRYEHGYE